MIAGTHSCLGVAVVLMPDGEMRLQLANAGEGTWAQINGNKKLFEYLRKHLKLEVIACEPTFEGTQEPKRENVT